MLLLEDMRPDARMLMEAFDELGLDVQVDHVEDVDAALAYIDRCLREPARDLPGLALVDIKVPGGSGIDVVRHLRRQPALREIPILMLTSSGADEDIAEARAAGATTYYIKPPDLDGFLALARELHAFWMDRARVPRG